jgi:hypothetical protein
LPPPITPQGPVNTTAPAPPASVLLTIGSIAALAPGLLAGRRGRSATAP